MWKLLATTTARKARQRRPRARMSRLATLATSSSLGVQREARCRIARWSRCARTWRMQPVVLAQVAHADHGAAGARDLGGGAVRARSRRARVRSSRRRAAFAVAPEAAERGVEAPAAAANCVRGMAQPSKRSVVDIEHQRIDVAAAADGRAQRQRRSRRKCRPASRGHAARAVPSTLRLDRRRASASYGAARLQRAQRGRTQ